MADDAATRNRRWRAHGRGDHGECLPRHCADAPATPAPAFLSATRAGDRAADILDTYPNASGAARLLVTEATNTAALIDHLELVLAATPGELAIIRELGAQRRLLMGLLAKLDVAPVSTPAQPPPRPSLRDELATFRQRQQADAYEGAL